MKKIIKRYSIDTFSLYVTSVLASGMVFERGIITILITGGALTITSYIAKPVINILLLPLNMVTFGVFRWISSAIILFLVTRVIYDFKIIGFSFSGYSSPWIDLPSFSLSGFFAFVGFSFILSVLTSFLHWLLK